MMGVDLKNFRRVDEKMLHDIEWRMSCHEVTCDVFHCRYDSEKDYDRIVPYDDKDIYNKAILFVSIQL